MHDQQTIAGWLTLIIGHEGAYVDHPRDPGGETKWGISKRSYPHLDIKNLSVEQAVSIYVRDYLVPIRADLYGPRLAFQMLDYAINSGVRTAVRALQRTVGVSADGDLGPVTTAALKGLDAADDMALAVRLVSDRLDWMTQLNPWDTFGRGWARRIARNMREAVR